MKTLIMMVGKLERNSRRKCQSMNEMLNKCNKNTFERTKQIMKFKSKQMHRQQQPQPQQKQNERQKQLQQQQQLQELQELYNKESNSQFINKKEVTGRKVTHFQNSHKNEMNVLPKSFNNKRCNNFDTNYLLKSAAKVQATTTTTTTAVVTSTPAIIPASASTKTTGKHPIIENVSNKPIKYLHCAAVDGVMATKKPSTNTTALTVTPTTATLDLDAWKTFAIDKQKTAPIIRTTASASPSASMLASLAVSVAAPAGTAATIVNVENMGNMPSKIPSLKSIERDRLLAIKNNNNPCVDGSITSQRNLQQEKFPWEGSEKELQNQPQPQQQPQQQPQPQPQQQHQQHHKRQLQQEYTECVRLNRNDIYKHIPNQTNISCKSNNNKCSNVNNFKTYAMTSATVKCLLPFNTKIFYGIALNLMEHLSQLNCTLRLIITYSILLMISMHQHTAAASASMIAKHEPMFISRSETFKFVAGDTIILPCEVANTDPYVVAWKRGIAILTAGSVKVTPDPRLRLVNGFNLQIRDAVPQDAGDYICQIATMEPREITHTVEILVPPRIHHISTSGHLQVKKGSSVRIECSASGNPTPNVTWSRKNNILPNGEEKLHSHILSIENVDRHKGGVYICTANNGVGQPASSQVVLHVLYPPEITVERPTVFSGEGHEAMLVCIVHGETQPEVIWFKDTMQLDTTERHIMENRGSRHTLIIRKVHPQDFGNYSCVAENQLGKSRKTLQLSGKPNVAVFNSPPISQYKDRYNISWTVESHTPIEEYKLSFRRLQQGQEVDNSIDSHSSSMLQMYGGGAGGGAISNSGISNANYRLTGGMNNLGGFAGYGVGSIVHWGRNDWRDVVLPAMPLSHHYTQGMSYMIRGLDPDQHYEATVQARNRYGWSDYSQSFVFSTSSNDGLTDLSAYLNHDHLSDNEMRDLSVTFYGSQASLRSCIGIFNYFTLSIFILLRHYISM